MAHKQDIKAIPTTQMDSRKFLGALNKSAQARVRLFESLVKNLGLEVGSRWNLAALHSNSLIIEDVDNSDYLVADYHQNKGGRVTIDNVRRIELTDSSKRQLFEQNCSQLLNAIEKNDRKGMQSAFTKLAAQRFSGRTIPEDGIVRTKDGVTRKVRVSTGILSDDTKKRLVSAIVESLSDRTVVNNKGRIIGKYGPAVNIKLPVTEWTNRKVIGRMMRDTASNAYKSPGFQNRIHHLSTLVYTKKIDEAKHAISGFLKEQQEFCLLNRQQIQTLIENTLACKAVFNQRLCEDVANLFYTVNLEVNRDDIIKEWRTTARKASNVNLLENVTRLENANNFGHAYDNFLKMIFIEAISPREVMVDAYKTALVALQQSPSIKESPDLAGKIQQLVNRLSEPAVDHAVIAEVEDVLASAKSELDAGATLDNFDSMPGGDSTLGDQVGDALAAPEEQPSSGKGVSIVINSPLINVGGEEQAADDGLGDGLDDDLDLGDIEGDFDGLGAEDVDDEGGDEEGDEEDDPDSLRDELDSLGEDDEDDQVRLSDFEEGADPYAYRPVVSEMSLGDYGEPALTDAGEIEAVVESMVSMASLDESADHDVVRDLAIQSLRQIGIVVPDHRLDETIELLTNEFYTKMQQIGEDQYKWATKAATSKNRRGLKRNQIKAESKQKVEWLHRDPIAEGIAGRVNDVLFSFDYAEPFAILSEDGSVVVPVPPNLVPSAKAVVDGKGDKTAFERWIVEGIEQFRAASDEDNFLIDEAVATIRTTMDGGLEIEVTPDEDGVEITNATAEGDDAFDGDALDGGDDLGDAEIDMGDDSIGPAADGEMAPVDGLPDDVGGESEDDVPDFGDDAGDEEGADIDFGSGIDSDDDEDQEGSEDSESDEMDEDLDDEDDVEESVNRGAAIGEDNDITDPNKSKYTKEADADPRKVGKPPKPGKSKTSLKGFPEKKDTSVKVDSKMKEVKPGENLPK